ncbi:hypothetical protein BU17DRAFT_22125, partial [Hysterangium stoloniferum]
TAKCHCGAFFTDQTLPTFKQNFIIFGLQCGYEWTIQVSKCISCKHSRRLYGSDLGSMGIFNWNNSFGFTHELLNQYTNVFTTCENPFVAFVTNTRRLYISSNSPVSFCSGETFTRVWFAFTDLQVLASGMKCPICGPYPDVVIADGVSIGYSSNKTMSGLCPPTMVSERNPIISTV